jgi:hypothetical protein
MNEGTRFGTTMHSPKVVQDSDAYLQSTDGKIKAPTAVGRMWLVRLRFFAIFGVAVPALARQTAMISTIQAPSLASLPREGREEGR